MFSLGKRVTLLLFFITILITVGGCANAAVTSPTEEDEATIVERSAKQEKDIELAKSVATELTELELDEQAGEEGQKKANQPADNEAEIAIDNTPAESEPAVEQQPIEQQSAEPQPATVSISIVGPQGEDYIILDNMETEWQDGDTVLEVLKRATRAERIHLEYRGRNKSAYIEGIDNLYEFDRGPLSGWVYRVNGVFPSNSAGAYPVEKGDFIEWLYTLDLGQDVGGHMQGAQGE